MSRSIKVSQLASEIEKQLTDYKDLAADELKKAVKKAGKTTKEGINDSAPVRTGKYENRNEPKPNGCRACTSRREALASAPHEDKAKPPSEWGEPA